MKRLLSCAAMLAMILLAGHAEATAPVKKKSARKQGESNKTTSTKKPLPSTAKRAITTTKKGTSTAATRSKNPPAKKTTWRNRQSTPSPERYREIQTALATRGYLKPEEATGTWNTASGDALKKFQAEQNLESKGKINSLSLIALGLGPHREPAAPAHPPTKDQQPPSGQ